MFDHTDLAVDLQHGVTHLSDVFDTVLTQICQDFRFG